MIIISIDPSSTRTGVANFRCTNTWKKIELLGYGFEKPKGDTADERIQNLRGAMKNHLAAVCAEYQVGEADIRVIIEKASLPYANRRMNRKAFNHYTQAVQSVADVFFDLVGAERVYGVYPQTWKKTEKKETTAKRMKLIYELSEKVNHDEIDAIALGTWWIERMRVAPIEPYLRCTL